MNQLILGNDPGDEQDHVHSIQYDAEKNLAEYPLRSGECIEPESTTKVFQLNDGQQQAHDKLISYILGEEPQYRAYLLVGPAGTGKTTTINRVVESMRRSHPHISFGMTAPTHKAVRQLRKHSLLKTELDFGTIHSFLALKEKQVPNPYKKGEYMIKYEPEWNASQGRRIDGVNVLIVDEASMLGDELYEHIEDAWRSNTRLKIIYMGDERQIPPVKESRPKGAPAQNEDAIPFVPAQRQSRKIGFLELIEIVRQAQDNPIIAYATDIRLQYKNQAIKHEFVNTNEHGVFVVSRDLIKIREFISLYFDTPMFREDPDYVKIVAWRNDTVNYMNNEVRLLINKVTSLPRIIIGDKLILDKPVLKADKILIANNEELEVTDVISCVKAIKYNIITRGNAFQQTKELFDEEVGKKVYQEDFKIYRTTVLTAENKQFVIDILHEDDIQKFDSLKKRISDNATKQVDQFDKKEMWREFFKLDGHFAQVKYNYCLTAHKAQGSTYDYCMSMEWDIDQNRNIEERNRIRYVAATRARNKLFIVK